ncbi:hypothetical protein CPLU01_04417 [Colletotrichum plurivorum]|uniref:Uncharacterized protein n=1 Tax=Colletotrichum plurivorum TaxID=2175906 RepID=A0A8H6NIY4_9PEZI|nr:hypothetical protein CPLU01_04417 [Colletotrichum plurivorum]
MRRRAATTTLRIMSGRLIPTSGIKVTTTSTQQVEHLSQLRGHPRIAPRDIRYLLNGTALRPTQSPVRQRQEQEARGQHTKMSYAPDQLEEVKKRLGELIKEKDDKVREAEEMRPYRRELQRSELGQDVDEFGVELSSARLSCLGQELFVKRMAWNEV